MADKKPADERIRYAWRVFLLVLLPFALGLWVLPHTQGMDGAAIGAPVSDASRGADGSVSYHFTHSQLEGGAQQLGALFPLANYADFPPLVSHGQWQLCFKDNGSRFLLADGSDVPAEIEWNISVQGQGQVLVQANSVNCTGVEPGQATIYQWSAKLGPAIAREGLNGTITFEPQTSTYPRATMDWGLLQGLVMIPVFYLLIWYPAGGIWRKIREGLLSQ
ncbi:Uncharacterised protein [uncultured archaeon]|nr:Uncharacterised protein [uncultured archaeon]